MRDLLPIIDEALDKGVRFAWARVIETWGSAPRRPGASMIVVAPDRYAGSVSGGCVEDAVIDEALGTLASGRPQILEYGVSDEDAWNVGLSCGGTLRIFVEPFPACSDNPAVHHIGRELVEAVRSGRGVVLRSAVSDTTLEPSLALLSDGDGRKPDLQEEWLTHPFPAPDRLFILGGSEIAVRLIPLARAADFETILIDPRGVLSTGRTFTERPDAVFEEEPKHVLERLGLDSSSYAVLLTHDPSIDDPALHALLASPAAYIGALGGRKTQVQRRGRLAQAGFRKRDLERIDGPVGMRIGAETPAEIAISIVAKLVQIRRSQS